MKMVKKSRSNSIRTASRKSSECNLNDLVANLVINDENWQCIVAMLVETFEDQERYTTMLEDAFENGYRKAIYLINHKKMLTTINTQTRTEPSYAAKLTSSHQRLRDCAYTTLSSHTTSTLLTAGLIKWMIYEARLESLARSAAEAELAAERDREFLAMQEVPTMKKEGGGGLPTKTAESTRRANSQLRRRDEEWRDRVCVNDAPLNGPNLYILLTGFHDPGLPSELIKLGVSMNCIFRLENLRMGGEEGEEENEGSLTSSFEVASGSLSTTSKSNIYAEFWSSINDDICKEVAIRSFCPSWNHDSDLSDIYDSMSYAMYDIYDLMESHTNYLNSMKIINVYEPRPEIQHTTAYESFLKEIPKECATVPVVLEAVLRQVEKNLKEQTHDPNDADDSQPLLSRPSKQLPTVRTSTATSLSKVNSSRLAFARLTEKLRLLNLKYELISTRRANDCSPRHSELELILHGDALRLNACRANDEAEWKFVSFVEEPRIARLWKTGDEKEMKNCKMHLRGVFDCCKKEGIDRKRANHLLNLLALRKMVESNIVDKSLKSNSSKTDLNESLEDKSDEKVNQEKNANINDKDINLSENNFIPTASRRIPRITNSVEKFIYEMDKVCRIRQRNIIFDELPEEPYFKENENSMASLNANPKQMRITKEFVWESHVEDDEKENAESYETTMFPDTTCCPCLIPNNTSTTRPQSLRTKSLDIPRLSSLNANSPSRWRTVSDDIQRRSLLSYEHCADLFGLIDARESCGLPGGQRRLVLEEFEDAESLGPATFLQIVRDCFQMDGWTYEAKHFVTTDSILLLFKDELAKSGTIIERRVICAPRTALCLRDFANRVYDEGHDWFKSNRELRGDCKDHVNRRWSKDGPVFNDEDFILPGSLKACELELEKEEQEREKMAELKRMEEEKMEKEKNEKKTAKTAAKPGKKSRKPSSISTKTKNERRSSPPTSSARIFDFIGYDLGEQHQVQISNLKRAFRGRDGTRVIVAREDLTLGKDKNRCTSVKVEVEKENEKDDGCSLYYHEVEGKEGGVFHLMMDNGIIVAFERIKARTTANELLFEIQMSWPSGLIIKPVWSVADQPFYILQYYEREDDSNDEICRKYLRNGDVVKFLKDDRVIVLRPYGSVITLVNFKGGDGDSDLSCECDEEILESVRLSRETSSLIQEICSESMHSDSSSLRYIVLEPDGRRYEVRGGIVVRELNRLRASLAEEYDPEEKFLRRADGTDILFTRDGELIVSFPDGTRTLSGYLIEDTLATCDWSDDELCCYCCCFGGREPEGFVSILSRGRVEHPKYATVVYEPDDVVSLTMGSLTVELGPRANGTVAVGDRIRVELNNDKVTLTRRACPSCNDYTSRATFHLLDSSSPKDVLLTFDDISSRLTIRRDGLISHESLCDCTICDCNKNTRKKRRFRIFAVNRDGTAHEYHHRSEWEEILDAMAKEEEASLMCSSIENRPGMEWKLCLRPLPTVIGSSIKWLMNYTIREVRPSRRVVMSDDEVDEPLLSVRSVDKTFLMARVFEGIGRTGENGLIAVQKALVRYWREIATGTRTITNESAAWCHCCDEAENRMLHVVMGQARAIAREIYETGRQHLRRLNTWRDEERTRRLIDRAYQRKCPRYNE